LIFEAERKNHACRGRQKPSRQDLKARLPADGIEKLQVELGGQVPAGCSRLADDELRDLTEAIQLAHRRHAQALAQAGERALGHIPRLLRVPIRRMLG
jgi:hypothetical protein